MKKYHAKPGAPFREKDAQRVGEFLDGLSERYGQLTPAAVVEAAQPERSPIHDYFTWDNDEAAAAYRLHQARLLVNHVMVEVVLTGGERDRARAFVHVSLEEEGGGADRKYLTVEAVMGDDAARNYLLDKVKAELLAIRRKYRTLQEFDRVWEEIDRIVEVKMPRRGRARPAGTRRQPLAAAAG